MLIDDILLKYDVLLSMHFFCWVHVNLFGKVKLGVLHKECVSVE